MGGKYTRWSKEDLERIKAISTLYGLDELAEFFGRSRKSIQKILLRYNLKHRDSIVRYTHLETENTKRCNSCEQILPLDAFHKSSGGRKGVYHCCRECYSIQRKQKRLEAESSILQKEKDKLKEAFMKENKDKTFFCNQCQCEKKLSDYIVSAKRQRNGTYRIAKDCKECKRRREAARARTRGYK